METPFTERTELLVGSERLERYRQAHILIVGLGGVGGSVLEMLARAGIGKFTLIDGDCVSASNVNRQILAFPDNVGRYKAEVAREHLLRINPNAIVESHNSYIESDGMHTLLSEGNYSFVVDAIDTIAPKTSLMVEAYRLGIPIISSMGAGAKVDPQCVCIADLSESNHCSLAKILRHNLREAGISKGIPVVYSVESPLKHAVTAVSGERNKRTTVGTISYLPNIFGCFMASYILSHL